MNRPTTSSSGGAFTYVGWPDRPIYSHEQAVQISQLSAEAGMWHHCVWLLMAEVTEGIWVPHPAMKRRWLSCFGKYRLGLPQEQRIAMASLMLAMCASELRDLRGIRDDG